MELLALYETEKRETAEQLERVNRNLAVARMEYRKIRSQVEAWETIVALERARLGGSRCRLTTNE